MPTKTKSPRLAGCKSSDGLRRHVNREESTLKRDIDAGVRYFWSRRGGVPYLTARGGVA